MPNSKNCIEWVGYHKTSQDLCSPPFATRLLRIEFIGLSIVAYGTLARSFSVVVQSYWILAGTGTCCLIDRWWPITGWCVQWVWDRFIFQDRCADPWTWVCAVSCCDMKRWWWMTHSIIGLRISSCPFCAFKFPSLRDTRVRGPKHIPPSPWATRLYNTEVSKPLTNSLPSAPNR